MRVGIYRTVVWGFVLAATVAGAPAAAWACADDATGAEACGGCFDTSAGVCTGDPCSRTRPCPGFNTFCTPKCAAEPPACGKDAECDDGKPCTEDVCIEDRCEHLCVCLICPVDR
jgi:hypothetical protein